MATIELAPISVQKDSTTNLYQLVYPDLSNVASHPQVNFTKPLAAKRYLDPANAWRELVNQYPTFVCGCPEQLDFTLDAVEPGNLSPEPDYTACLSGQG